MALKKPIPEDIKACLSLIKEGKLFALQDWINSGKRTKYQEPELNAVCCLCKACETGFHSIVELLLTSCQWDSEEKSRALSRALSAKRLDLMRLLLSHGADPSKVSFADVCLTMDFATIERFLRKGCDAEANNAFAKALNRTKARPLLRLIRSHNDRYPGLIKQASLALADTVKEGHERWAAMLRWAGADPHIQVPSSLYSDWDFERHEPITAAEVACSSGNVTIIKALKLQPAQEEAQTLINIIANHAVPEALIEILRIIPKTFLNHGTPPSCDAINLFFRYSPFYSWRDDVRNEEKAKQTLRNLEILLEAGAKWHPNPDDLRSLRRAFTSFPPRYAIRVIRLLLYVSDTVDQSVVLDFCNTPRIRSLVEEGDSRLSEEMEAMNRCEK